MMATALLSPTYPTMPHTASGLAAVRVGLRRPGALAAPALGPALLDHLLRAADDQRARRHVACDGRPGADVRALTDGEWRDERRVRAHEDAVVDPGLVLRHAIVVARDRPRPDVHPVADRAVADVRQMRCLRAPTDPRLLDLDEVADARAAGDRRLRAQVTERTELGVVLDHGVGDHAVRLEEHAIPETARPDVAAGLHDALGPDRRRALDDHLRIDDGVGANGHRVLDIGRGGVDDGHARLHEPVENAPTLNRGHRRQ